MQQQSGYLYKLLLPAVGTRSTGTHKPELVIGCMHHEYGNSQTGNGNGVVPQTGSVIGTVREKNAMAVRAAILFPVAPYSHEAILFPGF